jgi:uncharacterized protein (TIGR03382 family)
MTRTRTFIFTTVGLLAATASTANAGFLGFVASVRQVGGYTLVDVYAGVQNASDRFLNVYDSTISTSVAGGFFQAAGNNTSGWAPDVVGFTSSRNAIDSFMTAGGTDYLLPAGAFAAASTSGDPNFTGVYGSWAPAPGSAPANTVPALAGWYTNNPPELTNTTEGLSSLVGRVDGTGAAGANFGIWCAHLVLATTDPIVFGSLGNLRFQASASIKDGVDGTTTQGFSVIPAPGALALAGAAGSLRRRRRHG